MFARTVHLPESDQREGLRQSLIEFGRLKQLGRGDEIGDITYISSDPDIPKLLGGESSPTKPHPADPQIRLMINSLRADGWIFRG